jgi:hypothetical protein
MVRWPIPSSVNSFAGRWNSVQVALTALVAAVLMVLALVPHASAATPAPVFRVDGVLADATAENVLVAKEQAFSEASATALAMLYKRLARARDISRLPEPTPELAEGLTTVFQVMAEEASFVRYRLRARVTFDPDGVVRLFRRHGVQAYIQPSSPVLIVPILERNAIPVAFEEAGDWFEAVRKVSETQTGLVPLKVALGTPEDRMEPLEFLRRGERVSLDALRLRYDAQGVIVATVRHTPGRTAVQVDLTGFNGAGPLATQFEAVNGMDDAARQLQAFLEEAWKAKMGRGVSIAGVGRPPVQRLDPPQGYSRSFAPRTLRSGVQVRGERQRRPAFDPVGNAN